MKKIISALWVLLATIMLFWWQNSISYASSVTSQSTTLVAQDKLDAFLSKVENMKNQFNNDEKYEAFLESVIVQLKWLWTKYSSNTTISEMIRYLEKWLEKIKTNFSQNKDMDNFFCELNNNCANSVSSTQTTNTTVNTNSNTSTNTTISTPTTPSVAATTNSADTTVLLSWISHKVEWYDLSKSNYTYNYATMKLKSKTFWITYDFGLNLPEWVVYNSVLQAEDFCKSKWKWYRLPKSYELKNLYDLKSSIDNYYYDRYTSTIPNWFYRVIRNDNNPNVWWGTLLIPDFISLDVLQKIVRWTPINGTIAIDLPSGNNLDNYYKTLSRISEMSLVKNDDDSYYMIRSDNYSSKVEKNPTYSYNMPSIQSVLCVADEI